MSLFSKLFGGGAKAPAEVQAIEHNGFAIYPASQKEQGGYRLGARVEKGSGEEKKVHHLIRADTFQSQEEADKAAEAKAKMLIDQMGDRLFD